MHQSVGSACLLRLMKCKGLNKVSAQCFTTPGPIPIPVALVGFNEERSRALNTSASEMEIETKWHLIEGCVVSASSGKVILLEVKTE